MEGKKRILVDEQTGERFEMSIKKIEETTEEMEYKFPKVAIVIGHYEKAKGFHSKFIGDEWTFWSNYLIENIGNLCPVYRHNPEQSSYSKRQSEMALITKNYDLTFELHFNAHNEHASGAHAMYYASSKIGKELAELFTGFMLSAFNIESDYNVPVANKNVRGGQFIMKQKGTALLLEPFFADNKDDVKKFLNNKETFIDVIEEMIKYFYVKKANETTQNT